MTPSDEPTLSPRLTALFAAACGVIVANIYYAQPLIAPIAAELGLPARSAGLIVTLTQLGYGAGLLMIVPLADLIENRRLTLGALALAAVGLVAAGLAPNPAAFLACSLLIGFGSVAVQVLSPFAAHLAPPDRRGRVVGNIAMGIMLGIMVARPASSFLAAETSWRTVFFVAAGVMALTAAGLAVGLPERQPQSRVGYGALMASLIGLALRTPTLQRRAFYQSCLFASFSLFWTTVPLVLADGFGLGQRGIALFALAGVSGAYNAVFLESETFDSIMLFGPGAGGTPTASAVIGDVISIVNTAPGGYIGNCTCYKALDFYPGADVVSRFYLRVQVADEPGVLAAIAGVFGQEGVSIHSMQQTGAEDSAQLVLVLHPVREAAFFGALSRIAALPAVRSHPSVIRIEGQDDR